MKSMSASEIHEIAVGLKPEKDEWYTFCISGNTLIFRDLSLGQDKISVYRLETSLPREEILKQCKDHEHCEVCGKVSDSLEGEQCKSCREWYKESLNWKYKCSGCN